MKKKYSKPCIAVENFVLQEFIAGSCSVKMNYANDTCVTEDKLTTGGIDDKLAAQIKGIIHEYQYFQSTSTCSNEYKGTDAPMVCAILQRQMQYLRHKNYIQEKNCH